MENLENLIFGYNYITTKLITAVKSQCNDGNWTTCLVLRDHSLSHTYTHRHIYAPPHPTRLYIVSP